MKEIPGDSGQEALTQLGRQCRQAETRRRIFQQFGETDAPGLPTRGSADGLDLSLCRDLGGVNSHGRIELMQRRLLTYVCRRWRNIRCYRSLALFPGSTGRLIRLERAFVALILGRRLALILGRRQGANSSVNVGVTGASNVAIVRVQEPAQLLVSRFFPKNIS